MNAMPVHLRAQTDQALEAARDALPHIGLVNDRAFATLLGDIVTFVNEAGPDHLTARVRLLAVLELVTQTRENPCPDSSPRGWSP